MTTEESDGIATLLLSGLAFSTMMFLFSLLAVILEAESKDEEK
jgi:hypothetical protein